MLSIPVGGMCLFFAPTPPRGMDAPQSQRWKQLDMGGVSILTGKLLAIFFLPHVQGEPNRVFIQRPSFFSSLPSLRALLLAGVRLWF